MPLMIIQSVLKRFLRNSILLRLIILGGLFLFFIPTSQASCTATTTSSSQVFSFTAANNTANADITFSGTITCIQPQRVCGLLGIICITINNANVSPYICAKAVFSGITSSVSNQALAYQLVNLSVGGVTRSSAMSTDNWYGPARTVYSGNYQVPYSITFRVPANTNILKAYPTGSYQGSFHLMIDMQGGSGACEGSGGGGWDYADLTMNYTLTMPSYCQLNTSPTLDFGTISDINTASQNYDTTSAVFSVCNLNTPYTLYLGSGNNAVSDTRRMTNGSAYIPYQLYKTAPGASAAVWNEAGGTSTVGGSGGVSLTGTGSVQATTIYGRIAKGTAIPGNPGTYTDTVVITLTY